MSTQNEIVKLNIGGTLFQSKKSTLTKFNGYFKTILETPVPVAKSASGEIFVDRSPKHFDIILNFMRDGDVDLPESEKEMKEVSREARYYLLEGLIELCSLNIQDGLFQFLKDENDVAQATVNSKKPFLTIYFFCEKNGHIFWNHPISVWKKFIQKHKGKWNIFFKANSECEWDWKFYTDKKFTLGSGIHYCDKTPCDRKTGKHPKECKSPKTFLDHLEFHMNRFLDETVFFY